jgi:hypothetical protein
MIELLPELEWLVWLDADVLIHNSERRLSDLLDARFAVQVRECTGWSVYDRNNRERCSLQRPLAST